MLVCATVLVFVQEIDFPVCPSSNIHAQYMTSSYVDWEARNTRHGAANLSLKSVSRCLDRSCRFYLYSQLLALASLGLL